MRLQCAHGGPPANTGAHRARGGSNGFCGWFAAAVRPGKRMRAPGPWRPVMAPSSRLTLDVFRCTPHLRLQEESAAATGPRGRAHTGHCGGCSSLPVASTAAAGGTTSSVAPRGYMKAPPPPPPTAEPVRSCAVRGRPAGHDARTGGDLVSCHLAAQGHTGAQAGQRLSALGQAWRAWRQPDSHAHFAPFTFHAMPPVTLQPRTGSAAGPCAHLQCRDAGSPPCPAGSAPRAAGRQARPAPLGASLHGLRPRQAPARPPVRRSARRRRPAARLGAARPRPAPHEAPCWPPPRCRRAPAAHSDSSLPHGSSLGQRCGVRSATNCHGREDRLTCACKCHGQDALP